MSSNNIQIPVTANIKIDFDDKNNITDTFYLHNLLLEKFKNKLRDGILILDINNISYNPIVRLSENFNNSLIIKISFNIIGTKLTNETVFEINIDDITERDKLGEKKFYYSNNDVDKKNIYFCFLNNIKSLDKINYKINDKDISKDKPLNIKITSEPSYINNTLTFRADVLL